MPINGPRGAIPTSRGWENPKTGELLKSQKISQEQIDEWFGVSEPAVLTEAPVANTSLDDMSKIQLEALGRQHGIELDRRKRKDDLVEELEEFIDED